MRVNFAERLAALAERKQTDLALLVTPRLLDMPLPIQRYDDPFFPFGKAIIKATVDLVCAYMFDFAAYLALGAAGAIALERSIAHVGDDALTILHAPFATPTYAAAVSDHALNVDAVTLTDATLIDAYTADLSRGAFVLCAGDPVVVSYPGYWQSAGLLTHPGAGVTLRVAGESVLYAGKGDDFTDQARSALERLRS